MAAQHIARVAEPFPSWCRHLQACTDWVVLDTAPMQSFGDTYQETSVAILSHRGHRLFEATFKQRRPKVQQAATVQSYTDELAAFSSVWRKMDTHLQDKLIVSYGAAYNSQLLMRIAASWYVEMTSHRWQCAMVSYAEYWQEPGRYRGTWRWQSLTEACTEQGLAVSQHCSPALNSARSNWRLIQRCTTWQRS